MVYQRCVDADLKEVFKPVQDVPAEPPLVQLCSCYKAGRMVPEILLPGMLKPALVVPAKVVQ